MRSRRNATKPNEKTAPAARATTSIALPMCERSLVPIATTSPVATRLGSVAPRRTDCRVTSWTTRYAAVSQFVTASRWRSSPEADWRRPMPSMSPASPSRVSGSFAATPRSIASPTTAGIAAWHAIHTTAMRIASSMVCHCPLASHHRNRPGERESGVPGWARGRRRTGSA